MINKMPKIELFNKGHNACHGCGAALCMRLILKAAGKDIITTIATGCMSVISMPYPLTAFKCAAFHSAFENAAATASGISRSLIAQNKKNTKVIAIAGDGGTFDIGFQSLSGALERKEKITFVCYDNEAYMNTGIQRSGATPLYSDTTTTPYGSKIHGKLESKKPMPLIVASHKIPYVATANIAYPEDLINKIKKALELQPSYIQIICPCIPGWKMASDMTIEVAKKAVETGAWPLFEIENGEFKLNYKPDKLKPVREYLMLQGRFKHLSMKEVEEIQKIINSEWELLKKGRFWDIRELF